MASGEITFELFRRYSKLSPPDKSFEVYKDWRRFFGYFAFKEGFGFYDAIELADRKTAEKYNLKLNDMF